MGMGAVGIHDVVRAESNSGEDRGQRKLTKLAAITGRTPTIAAPSAIGADDSCSADPVVPRGQQKLAKLATATGRHQPRRELAVTPAEDLENGAILLLSENDRARGSVSQIQGFPGEDPARAMPLMEETDDAELSVSLSLSETSQQAVSQAAPAPIEEGLAVAHLVSEPSAMNLPVGTLEDHDEEAKTARKKRTKSYLVGCCFSGLVLLVAIILGIIFGKKHNSESQVMTAPNISPAPTFSSSPSFSPTFSSREIYIKSLLPDYTLQSIQNDTSSPQSQAMDFLLDDHASLENFTDWRIR